jgi:hypothetical protein
MILTDLFLLLVLGKTDKFDESMAASCGDATTGDGRNGPIKFRDLL